MPDAHNNAQSPADLTAAGNHKQRRSHWSRVKQGWKRTTINNKLVAFFTAVIAVSNFLYVLYARRQWTVMGGQLAVMSQTLTKLQNQIDVARDANTYAIETDRPWMGPVESLPGDNPYPNFQKFDDPQSGALTEATYMWKFQNGGKRPAIVTDISTRGYWYTECTETPDYSNKDVPGRRPVGLEPRQFAGRGVIVIPNSTVKSLLAVPIPKDKWDQITKGTLRYCIYSRIEYADIKYPTVIHHAQTCMVYSPEGTGAFFGCQNKYADSN
jgi:hypothetical protein